MFKCARIAAIVATKLRALLLFAAVLHPVSPVSVPLVSALWAILDAAPNTSSLAPIVPFAARSRTILAVAEFAA